MPEAWKVSLHGGHSRGYCDHAFDPLRAMLDAAVAEGYSVFGVTEHVPRYEARHLYEAERAMGWDVASLERNFEAYLADLAGYAEEYADRLTILRGAEIEVVPHADYAERMTALRARPEIEYIVGSVHFLHDTPIDGPRPLFEDALAGFPELETMTVAYYRAVAEMAATMQPEVAAHFDLMRKNGRHYGDVETPAAKRAAGEALEAIRAAGAILDVNTAGYRKGLGGPYPAPWVVETAQAMGIGFCFGDDSHGVADVGAGLADARDYLLAHGVRAITALTRDGGGLKPEQRPLA